MLLLSCSGVTVSAQSWGVRGTRHPRTTTRVETGTPARECPIWRTGSGALLAVRTEEPAYALDSRSGTGKKSDPREF